MELGHNELVNKYCTQNTNDKNPDLMKTRRKK